jgi:hypothetical protein
VQEKTFTVATNPLYLEVEEFTKEVVHMKYDAFISYRHSDLDMYVAKKLHKGLETFKVPQAVAKKSGKKSIKRVFRDQEELPIGSDLGDNIANALRES